MKNVQIPEELFINLCRCHLLGTDNMEEWEEIELLQSIKNGLQNKLDSLLKRELYSKYKDTTLTEKERQEARQAYLDAIGMREGYRWSSLEPPT